MAALQRKTSFGAAAAHVGLVLVGVLGGSCVNLGAFECTQDDQCRLDGQSGICAAPGYCALPDATCESGFSFHARAPSDLVGQCVEPVPASESSTGVVGSGTTSASTTGSGESTGGREGSGPSLSTGAPGTGVLCGDRPCACAVDIAAGEEHTCALRDDGSVVCWGVNDQGELGTGVAGDPVPWPQDVALPRGVTASRMEMGNHITCVTGSDGGLYCWGRNVNGEVLPDTAPEPVAEPVRIDFTATGGAYGLSPRHSCVATENGATVGCFGENQRGQLGSMEPGPGPFTVADPMMLLAGVDELAAGRQHTCARSGTAVACWGADSGGALGNGVPVEDTSVPQAVLVDGDAVLLTSGRAHACVALDDGRRMQCWGNNESGQLATGDAGTPEAAPVDAVALFDAPVQRFVSRLDSTCAITTDGGLRCWGLNGEDKYGTGNDFEATPIAVSLLDEVTEPVTMVAVGEWHMCVISEGAHVWCWGADDVEQLGPFDPMPGERAVELDLRCPDGR